MRVCVGPKPGREQAPAGGALSLQAAISATMAHNPELSGLKFRRQALEAERYSAGLKPEVRLSAEAENIAGSGDYTGGQSAETTLAISSIIELGGKRDARLSLAGERQAAGVFVERITELEVLAELTRRFIAVASAQEMLGLQQTSLQLAAQTTRALKLKWRRAIHPRRSWRGRKPKRHKRALPCTRRSCVLRMPKPNWRASGPRQTRHLAACKPICSTWGPPCHLPSCWHSWPIIPTCTCWPAKGV